MTLAELDEQFRSRLSKVFDVDDDDDDDDVDVDDVLEARAAASFASASLARLASIPVPAANPTTAADNIAMMTERMKIAVEQPQMVALLVLRPGSDCGAPAIQRWSYGAVVAGVCRVEPSCFTGVYGAFTGWWYWLWLYAFTSGADGGWWTSGRINCGVTSGASSYYSSPKC